MKTNLFGNNIPKVNMHYTCTVCFTIDSVMRIDKENHLQVYLEECKYKVKKPQMSRFINTKLKSDSDSSDSDSSDSDLDDNDLMTKLGFWFWISHCANFKEVKKNYLFCWLWAKTN